MKFDADWLANYLGWSLVVSAIAIVLILLICLILLWRSKRGRTGYRISRMARHGEVNHRICTPDDIIRRIRQACDKIYEEYEGHPLIEKNDILDGFEEIINDYYEEQSLF